MTSRFEAQRSRARAYQWWSALSRTGEIAGYEGPSGFERFLSETRWKSGRYGYSPFRKWGNTTSATDFIWVSPQHPQWTTPTRYLRDHGLG